MNARVERPETDREHPRKRAEAGGWLDRVLEIDVGPVAHGGHCVGRVDGRVVFVRHALPGERVRAVVTEDRHGAFCRADAIAVLHASPDRVEPSCVWARAGGCGGCDFQHATPEAQRALKADVLAEQLERLGGVSRRVEVEELPGGVLGWRTRVRLAVGDDGRAGLRAHRAHDVIPIADCPITVPDTLPEVLAEQWSPGTEVEVERDAEGTVHVTPASRGFRQGDSGVPAGRFGVSGSSRAAGPVVRRANGREWRLPPGVFWQAHPALPDALCEVVADWAGTPVQLADGRAWDLYGGVGVLGSVLADLVGEHGEVTVVESASAAVRAGQEALAGLPRLRWRIGRVERVLPELLAAGRPDVVVADPPRGGLGRAVVEQLVEAAPARLVHVACDPAALARDVALLAERGYRLERLRAFDAFPMTHHLEAVALFVR